MMSLFRASQATKQENKVFGLLCLCREMENAQTFGIEEDCNLSVRDTYIRTAVSILNTKQNLDLFVAVRFQPEGDSVARLPSWAPNVCISS